MQEDRIAKHGWHFIAASRPVVEDGEQKKAREYDQHQTNEQNIDMTKASPPTHQPSPT